MDLMYECIKSYTNKEIGEIYKETDKPKWFKNFNSIKEYKEKGFRFNQFFKEVTIIPEYVEYIDTKYKGKIVKVEDWCCGSYCKVIFYNGIKEQPFKHLVKPSTKEAYEAQNKPKQLNVKDLIKGEIYVFDINSTKNFISKFDYSDSYNYYDTCFIQGNEFYNEPESATIGDINNIRLANNEEKKWLNVCITQDKFIPKEDLHLYDDSGLLIKKRFMFRKNDHIVCLNEISGRKGNANFCYKLIKDEYVINNTDSYLFFDQYRAISIPQHQVRYATPEEIVEYEKIGKPYDVTTLKSLEKQVEEGLNKFFQYPLTPKKSFFTKTDKMIINGLLDKIRQPFKNDINSEDVYITPIIKKETKIQTITIESTTNLNLNLKTIKPKQIQTIKI